MDKSEVKVLIRSLISSRKLGFDVRGLLRDFEMEAGCPMPLFEFRNPIEFLQSIPDTVRLSGYAANPEVVLVKSKKSAHITTLVDEQKDNRKFKFPCRQRRIFSDESNRRNPPPPQAPCFRQNAPNIPPSFPRNEVPPFSRPKAPAPFPRPYAPNSLFRENDRLPRRPNEYHAIVSKYAREQLYQFLRDCIHGATLKDIEKALGPDFANSFNSVHEIQKACNHTIVYEGKLYSIPVYEEVIRFKELEMKKYHSVPRSSTVKAEVKKEIFEEIDDNPPVLSPEDDLKTNESTNARNADNISMINGNNNNSARRNVSKGAQFYVLEEEDEDEDDASSTNSYKKNAFDSESNSGKTSSDSSNKFSCIIVNDKVKARLSDVIKKHPDGLWCCELSEEYEKKYGHGLDFREFGCTSLIQLISELTDIFRCYRPGDGDWILFDAEAPVSKEEEAIRKTPNSALRIPNSLKSELLKLLVFQCKTNTDLGMFSHNIQPWYFKMYHKKLDYETYGFNSFVSFLECLEGEVVHLQKVDKNILVVPILKKPEKMQSCGDALPQITPDDDTFIDLFPEDAVGPKETIIALELSSYVKVGVPVEVCVAEVYNPKKFYLQLQAFQTLINDLMADLNSFYASKANSYQMPDCTIQPGQYCAGYYDDNADGSDEWHRGRIVSRKKTGVLVNFVDFGTVTTMKKDFLKFLHRDFQSTPAQAFLASLANIQPPNGEKKFTPAASARFLELVSATSMKADVISVDYVKCSASVILSEILDGKQIVVNDVLVKEGFAVYTEEHSKTLENFYSSAGTNAVGEKKKPAVPEMKKEITAKSNILKARSFPSSVGVVSPVQHVPPNTSYPVPSSSTGRTPMPPIASPTVAARSAYLNRIATGSLPSIDVLTQNAASNLNDSSPCDVSAASKDVPPGFSLARNLDYNPPFDVPVSTSTKSDVVGNNSVADDDLRQAVHLLEIEKKLKDLKDCREQILQSQQKKREDQEINSLGLRIFQNHEEIRKLARINPEKALKLAMQMARMQFGDKKSVNSANSFHRTNVVYNAINVTNQLNPLQNSAYNTVSASRPISSPTSVNVTSVPSCEMELWLLAQSLLQKESNAQSARLLIRSLSQNDPNARLLLQDSLRSQLSSQLWAQDWFEMQRSNPHLAQASLQVQPNNALSAQNSFRTQRNDPFLVRSVGRNDQHVELLQTLQTQQQSYPLSAQSLLQTHQNDPLLIQSLLQMEQNNQLSAQFTNRKENFGQFGDENKGTKNDIGYQFSSLNLESPTEESPKPPITRPVKKAEITGKAVHLINVDDKLHVCLDELIKKFTPLEIDTAYQLLARKNVSFDFKVITRDDNRKDIFEELEKYDVINQDPVETELCLLPLKCVIQFFQTIACMQRNVIMGFHELWENFDPKEEYWYS